MHFSMLQDRLVAHLRSRVRGGELTERSAARLTGVSQPHLHNVLKGTRLLSTDMADQVLRSLKLCIFDLLEPDEFRDYHERAETRHRTVPVLAGRLGPGRPFPTSEHSWERCPFPLPGSAMPADPAIVHLLDDPHMYPLFRGGDTALLDRAPGSCRQLVPGACYAVDISGEGLIRRFLGDRFAPVSLEPEAVGDFISLNNRNILEIVKAKVVWIGRNLEPPSVAPRSTDQDSPQY